MAHNLSKRGRDALKGYEALRLMPYLDGKHSDARWTIGYGHTKLAKHFWECSSTWSLTLNQAELLLDWDLSWVQNEVGAVVKVPLTQSQYDALVCLAFNIGGEAFGDSTLVKKLNVKDYDGAAREFLRWVYDNGKIVKGLINRRAKERAMFLEAA